jgi:uncharacterized protein
VYLVRNESYKGAAIVAALFVFAACVSMPVFSSLITPVAAKMRVDKLSIEPLGGGAARTFDIEIASSDQEKSLGLMFRTQLADTEGMLFPYGKTAHVTMWMHNTYISLDMLFIRADGTIVRIESRAEPLTDRIISSEVQVFAVLELAGGAAERLGIKAGDHVSHAVFSATKAP